ncbi:hypothetical protein [Bradyrhizobium diazoefficiens]
MKSIRQEYMDADKLIGSTRRIQQNPSRLNAELQVRFWSPIIEAIDPRGSCASVSSSWRDILSPGPGLLPPHAISESVQRMKGLLGVSRLTLGTWFKLRPVFKSILIDAQTCGDMDLIACMARQFVRLDLGYEQEPNYGGIGVEWQDYDLPPHEFWAAEDKRWEAVDEFGTSDFTILIRIDELRRRFEDPEVFESAFPGSGHRRAVAIAALRPILDLRLDLNLSLTETAIRYMTKLLSMTFEETRLMASKVAPRGDIAA